MMKPLPPMLIVAMDSETEPRPLSSRGLTWSAPHGTVLSYATVIAVLYDPEDVYDADKIRKGLPKCVFTDEATKEFQNIEEKGFKRVTTLVYSANKVKYRSRWDGNLRDGYRERAVKMLGSPNEGVVKTLAGELMKEDITRDIAGLIDRVKYSMLLAQNINYDYTTMVSKQVLDKNGWVEAFYTRTSLNAGGHLVSPGMRFGDFLGAGSFGMLFKRVPSHVKTAYIVDLFGHITQSLSKSGDLVGLKKKRAGEFRYPSPELNVIAYNVRDTEILIDTVLKFPEIMYLSTLQIELEYAILKALKGLSLNASRKMMRQHV